MFLIYDSFPIFVLSYKLFHQTTLLHDAYSISHGNLIDKYTLKDIGHFELKFAYSYHIKYRHVFLNRNYEPRIGSFSNALKHNEFSSRYATDLKYINVKNV